MQNTENPTNNRRERTNTNTRGIQLMNSEGVLSKSTLVLGYWNDFVSIKLHPMLPQEQQTDFKKYNYDQALTATLTLEKVQTLLTVMKEALETEKDKFFKGVTFGTDSLAGVGMVKNPNDPNEKLYFFGVYKGLDPDTRIPKEKLIYEFRTIRVIADYDADAGVFDASETKQSEFTLLMNTLQSSLDHLVNAGSHAEHHSDAYNRKRQLTTMNSIAQKVGAETGYSNNYSGGGYQNNQYNNNGGGGQYNNNGGQYNNNGGGYQNNEAPLDRVKERNVANIDQITNLLN